MNDLHLTQIQQINKRVLTEARKLQNRLAQRAYRQRQKEQAKVSKPAKRTARLHELRSLRPRDLKSSPASQESPQEIAPTSVPEPIQQRAHATSQVSGIPEPVTILQDSTSSECLQWSDTGALDLDEIHEATLSTARFVADIDTSIVKSSFVGPMGVAFPEFGDCRNLGVCTVRSAHDKITGNDLLSSTAPHSGHSLSACEVRNGVTPDVFFGDELPATSALNISMSHRNSTSYATYPLCLSTSLEETSTNIILPQQVTVHTNTNNTIPSPYINLLTPYQTGIISAFIHNARVLGIARHELLTNLPLSPLYRPYTTLQSLSSTSNTLSSKPYPPHLQPTHPQILFPHHSYLDLLPFPLLRERAISWGGGREGAILDDRELKLDIVMGGLVCSESSSVGAGEGYLSGWAAEGGGGQPWDRRSWKVAGWFLRKWRVLLC